MADDYSGAAAKHLTDSDALLSAERWDGAGYLAGYGVECAVKLILRLEGKPPQGHLRGISSRAALPRARSARYVKKPGIHSLPLGRPAGWAPDLRYEAAGGVDEDTARAWVAEARRLYVEIVLPMKLDGVTP